MSLVFSDTTLKKGLIQRIERKCGFNDGDITGNATLFAQFTSDVNSALDKAFAIIFEVGGTWQFDDSNHTDYPIITTNLVSGQRDYAFTVDGSSNLILDIYRVQVRDNTPQGLFYDIYPVDVQTGTAPSSFTDGQNLTGMPQQYDKTANGIFLDAIPSYNSTGGLKLYINREGSYFTVSDTTKKPGFAGLFHDYIVLKVAYDYCSINQIGNYQLYKTDMLEMEEAIKNYYKAREKDVHNKKLIPAYNCSR